MNSRLFELTMLLSISCAALTVRFLTRRFIGEYGEIGEWIDYYCASPPRLLDGFLLPHLIHSNFRLLHLSETIYSHSFSVDGRELTLSIWDSPYAQVNNFQ